MNKYKSLDFRREGHCVHLRLNRPDHANSVDRDLAAELAAAAHRCAADSSVRAVVLTGEGRFFCAGGDVAAMASFGESAPSEVKLLVEDFHQAISSFARMRAPLIAAVNGHAAGAGFSLAAAADLVVASEDSTFTMAYTAVGLSPDGSSSFFLPRLIGLRRTQELMLTNRRLTARDALRWGLVTRVVPQDQVVSAAQEWATSLAAGSLAAHGYVKKLLLASFDNGLETQMAMEARAIAASIGSADGREGVQAFIEKRAPQFPA